MIVRFSAFLMEADVEYEFPEGTTPEEIEQEFNSWIENNLHYTIEEVDDEADAEEDF